MRDGFIKVAAGTPQIRVADCRYNAEQIFTLMREADKQGVRVLALPELCLTGYTCGDLFLQDTLLRGAEEGLATILEATKHLELLAAVGLPVRHQNKLYNCAAVLHRGEILALVPKTYLPNYGEFYEKRWFEPAGPGDRLFSFCGQEVYLGSDVIFPCESMPGLTVGVEICEDLWASTPPSVALAEAGATVILNLSASDELVGKAEYRRRLVCGQSARLVCGYVYANAGEGESTTDLVFNGHNIVAENGALLVERRFATGLTVSEVDVERLDYERRRLTTFRSNADSRVITVPFALEPCTTTLTRHVNPLPFVPEDGAECSEHCDEIILLAALGLPGGCLCRGPGGGREPGQVLDRGQQRHGRHRRGSGSGDGVPGGGPSPGDPRRRGAGAEPLRRPGGECPHYSGGRGKGLYECGGGRRLGEPPPHGGARPDGSRSHRRRSHRGAAGCPFRQLRRLAPELRP